MKICIVAQTFAPQEEGGAEIVARMSAIELSRRHDVFVLALGLEGDVAPPGETVGADGIRVLRVRWKNSYLPGPRKPAVGRMSKLAWHLRSAWGATSARDLKQLLSREKVDLVYAHNSARMQPALFDATRALGIPLCLHLHDYALLCPKASMFKAAGNCETPCMECRILTSRVKASDGSGVTAIAVSEALKQRFLDNDVLPKADWHILPNTYVREQDLPRDFLRRTGPADGSFTFGYVGALSEEKGIEDLITAFLAICGGHDVRLQIAGRGRKDYEDHLKSLTRGAPIEFLGFVKADQVYREVDAVVVPSVWNEPQGMILIEAAVYGVPVIGAARGGIPEIVVGERTGWCYEPDEEGALSSLLVKAARIGKRDWWLQREIEFPGTLTFKGTSEASGYYEKLNDLLVQAGTVSLSEGT
ncbi:glycosyltransferase family 4 protein [Agrobacterium larrymoorei]|uniref:glycosyltransferase n=1 Tax=Agrobacterium larrymoorei TaxID=160699 RepID=UPI0015731E9D|nr:glycosyltransferase [Agrobacterium larrymoorei]NTJ44795.1 glycosyltransferase family 4 protein [Agrobacterium larrymoorei]